MYIYIYYYSMIYYMMGCDVIGWDVHVNAYIYIYIYLRAAAPAADPGRIGKEAKQIGIKTLRCFAP